ncbi:hypothetical protein H7Y21_01005 [Arenimonas sp.]|nr:hypothetical protein [Candidatus Parcubacteria bacterium]
MSYSSEQNFDWIPFYEELADKLVVWRDNQKELIGFLEGMRLENFPITPLRDVDENGNSSLLNEIDPFTFFGVFNRAIRQDYRIKILERVKVKFSLSSNVPKNFEGIPIINNVNSWFIAYKRDRKPDDVNKLWDIFSEALKSSPLNSKGFADAFNKALTVKYTSNNLTFGLFWIRPNVFVSLDQNILNYLDIKIQTKLDFAIYSSIIYQVKTKYTDIVKLSHDAYALAKEKVRKNDLILVDEIDKKIELANAYIDMDDKYGARELINEIIADGNKNQIKKAKRLLDLIGTDALSINNPEAIIADSYLTASRSESLAVKDVLGRGKITKSLFRLLTEREDVHPFAIGLFGHWGTGKSSQINFLKEELIKSEHPQVLMAEFNAWYNEKATNISAMLAQSVVDSLVKDMGFWDRFKLASQLAFRRNNNLKKVIENDFNTFKAKYLSYLFFPPQILISLPVLICLFYFAYESVIPLFPTLVITSITVVYTINQFSNFVTKNLTEWFRLLDVKKVFTKFQLPDYSTQQGLILDIHRTLQNICELCLGADKQPKQGKLLLLVVDDLDRCSVDTVKEVLDAVRLVAHIPRVVTLVAIDERMAFAAVEKHYKDFGHAGRAPALVARDYLAKVLQVSVTLPSVDLLGVESFVDDVMFKDISDSTIITDALKKAEGVATNISESTQEIPNQSSFEDSQTTTDELETLVSDSTMIKISQTSLVEEKVLFKKLTQEFDFTNPRLVWRLYMAWKLLKSMLFESYKVEDIDAPMRILFWQEWLHQQETEKKEFLTIWIKGKSGHSKPESMPGQIYDAVNQNLRPKWREYETYANLADSVLLPSSLQK